MNKCLDELKSTIEIIRQTSSYAYLAVAVDQTNDKNQERNMKLMNILSNVESKLSFVRSEIIKIDQNIIE